jgi:RNA polymerase sigma factor (sigma-70 family)
MTDMLSSVNRPTCARAWIAACAVLPTLEGAAHAAYRGRMNEATRPPDAAELATLVLRVADGGDRAAFAALFGHFAPRVKAYLLRLGADAATAEDLMQDVMVTVWRRAVTYDPAQAGVGTWIFTIARNKRIDALRRERRPELDPSDPAFAPDPPVEPERAAALGQWESRLGAALAALPREQSEMLRLAYFEDLSHGEIARRLGLPLGTVKSRVRLAIARLRERFPDDGSRS